MSDSTKNEIVGCISSIRRRLLCTCIRIRMRTSDFKRGGNLMQVGSSSKDTQKANVPSVSPGIVPRLMGLESMPEPKHRPRRSVDSIDFGAKYDPSVYRQVGQSVSFRDLPTYLKDEEKEFFLARAGIIWQKKSPGSEVVERRKRTRKEKQVLEETVCNENDYKQILVTGRPIHIATRPITADRKDSMKHTETSNGKIQNHINRAADRLYTSSVPKTLVSAKDLSEEKCPRVRRKQQEEFLGSKFSPRRQCVRKNKSMNHKTRSSDQRTKSTKSLYYLKSKRDSRKLAKEDMRMLYSKPKELCKQVNRENFGIEFAARILDGLLHEVVTELWGFHLNRAGS